MEVLADINVLLALCDLSHSHHGKVSRWFDTLEEGSKLLICRVAQMGLLRLMVNPSVMQGSELSLREAWSFYGNLLQDSCIFEVKEPDGLQAVWAELCMDFGSSPKVVADAYLAAFAIAGKFKLVTLDRAFTQYNQLNRIQL